MARAIARAAQLYLERLPPPMFKALMDYTLHASYSWHTPGHGGGVAFRKSPVGQLFYEFFGENTLRSDISVSVGTARLAARPHRADRRGRAQRGAHLRRRRDAVRGRRHLDRKQDRLARHGRPRRPRAVRPQLPQVDPALADHDRRDADLSRAVAQRPRDHRADLAEQFTPESIAQKIAASPFAKETSGKVRLMVMTNSTYDGLCYNVDAIKQLARRHASKCCISTRPGTPTPISTSSTTAITPSRRRSPARSPHAITFATHSTHKLLAALSQASMIHVQHGENAAAGHGALQRSVHDAHLDLAAIRHHRLLRCRGGDDGAAGRPGAVQETIDEALSFRRAMTGGQEADQGLLVVRRLAARRDAQQSRADDRADWVLKPGDRVARLRGTRREPCPGRPDQGHDPHARALSADGSMQEHGIPAAVVTKFLSSRRIEIEKTGLYSFLVLFSMGITKGKWSTLVTELLNFKDLYDANAPLKRVSAGAGRGASRRLRRRWASRTCASRCTRSTARTTCRRRRRTCTRRCPRWRCGPPMPMSKLVRGQVESVEIDELMGRTLAVMVVPYPPGIPLIMPGERITEATKSIQDYLLYAREFDRKFPGFETDIHGLRFEPRRDGRRYLVDCVMQGSEP